MLKCWKSVQRRRNLPKRQILLNPKEAVKVIRDLHPLAVHGLDHAASLRGPDLGRHVPDPILLREDRARVVPVLTAAAAHRDPHVVHLDHLVLREKNHESIARVPTTRVVIVVVTPISDVTVC